MFKESNYDKILLMAPAAGMNRNISGDSLPENCAYYLKNLIPYPLGELNIRYGTKLIFDTGLNITKAFPFRKPNNDKQLILYCNRFDIVPNITNAQRISDTHLRFTAPGANSFKKDTYIKINYQNSSGIFTNYYLIESVNYLGNNTIEIIVPYNSFSSDYTVLAISRNIGFIRVYDFATNQLLTGADRTIDNLALDCIPRGQFQGQFSRNIYWLFNGIDPIMTWDGDFLEIYREFVKENSRSFLRVDNTHFSFKSIETFDINKYNPGNIINLKIDQVSNFLTIVNTVINNVTKVITITTQQNIPNFTGSNAIELFYSDIPPAFSYMASINERMFCLGNGAAGIDYRPGKESLNIYYSSKTNTDINGFRFFDESEKEVPVIDISGTHGGSDNIEAIVNVNGKTAFLGRNSTQIWTGIDPDNKDSPSYFHHETTLPSGAIHGDLVEKMENDVQFISSNGIKSLSSLNIAQQMAITPLSAIDPIITQYTSTIFFSNNDYRSCNSFRYKNGGFTGFKIGLNDVIISVYKSNSPSWLMFTGDFKNSSCFVDDLDDALYMFIGTKIYQYSDGTYYSKSYGDEDGTRSVDFLWTAPLMQRRWANNFVRIYADYSSSFLVQKINSLSLLVTSNFRKQNLINESYEFEEKGDVMGSVPMASSPNLEPVSGLGFRMGKPFDYPIKRLKFQSSAFWISIAGKCLNSSLSLKKIQLFGRGQR